MSDLRSCLGPDGVDDDFQTQHRHGRIGHYHVLDPQPYRANLPCLNQHPWVKMGREVLLSPLCEEDKEVTVQMLLSLMWDPEPEVRKPVSE